MPKTLHCSQCNIEEIQSWNILKLRKNGLEYEERVNESFAVQFGDADSKVLLFRNVSANAEGQYKCVGEDGIKCRSGCLFVAGNVLCS